MDDETKTETDPAIIRKYQEAQTLFYAGDTGGSIGILRGLAAEGFPQAKHVLGNIYLWGSEPDADAALQLYLEAAAANFPPAFNSLGNMYYGGYGVEKSVRKALEYYAKGAVLGDVDCLVFSGELLASGELGEANHELAMPAYWGAARLGSPLAQRRLGIYYSQGKEVELDLKLASELYEAAASQGDEFAAHNLAIMYETGNSAVAMDLNRAINWYEVAANKGIVHAQHNLAACLTRLPDVSYEIVVAWFLKAAEQGSRLSMESLSRMYESGEGVECDPEKAEYWRQRASVADDQTVYAKKET